LLSPNKSPIAEENSKVSTKRQILLIKDSTVKISDEMVAKY
jgi:hypothetical protein